MVEVGSMWNDQEDLEKLKFSLQFTTIELESLKIEANEQKRKHSEEIKHLLSLLKLAYKERDEAREQLQLLINKLAPHPQSEIPIVIATKANSVSNSVSDAYNHHHPHGCSSPGDSFFDTVTSPDFSTMKVAAGSCNMMGFGNQLKVPMVANVDSEVAVIDDIAKGRTLPQKGKLLQAVLEAGPLLETLIVAGPLPCWRNPPPLQPFKIPVVSLKGASDVKTDCRKLSPNPNATVAQKRLNRCSESILSFASSEMLNTVCGVNAPVTIVKRQKVSTS